MIKKAAKEQDTIKSPADLQKLVECLKSSFSFYYKTIRDAKRDIKIGTYIYSYDATSLYQYKSNLTQAESAKLDEWMRPFYKELYEKNREAYKELCERRTLLKFLLYAPEEYRNSIIEKHDRPDFVLYTSEKQIGIEITELTTQYDKNLSVLANQIRENGLRKPSEIKEHIRRYHPSIESKVEIVELPGSPAVASGLICLDANRLHYACRIKQKHDKYSHEIRRFDEFIILADAASGSGLEISEKREVDEVIDHLLQICPEVTDTTVVIAWREAKRQERIIHSWYYLQE